MPWCVPCARYLTAPTVRPDGSCPTCGHAVDTATDSATRAAGGSAPSGTDQLLPPVPWHLKLLGIAVAAYLALRAWQGVAWIADRF